MNKKLKVLSLFDGMSVAQQALTELGYELDYYASEIDPYAIAVTQSNFPNTKQVGSVTELRTFIGAFTGQRHFTSPTIESKNQLAIYHMADSVDLLIGGSPCQDLSIAKKNRRGLDGDRSGLFWEYVRILNEVKPKYFVLENVASMPQKDKDIITQTLGVEPIMINASLVSAQNRKRLFWTNIPNVTQPEDRGILLKDVLEENVDEKYFLTKDVELTPSTNKDIQGTLDTGTWSKRFEQIRRVYKTTSKCPTIPTGTGGGVMVKIAIPVALRNRGEGKKPEYNGTGKANAMTSVQTDSMVEVENQIRKLTPTECLRLQSMPDNYFDKAIYKGKPISNSQRYKMCGNAFNCAVVKHILKNII